MEDQKWVEVALRQQSLCLLLEEGESRKNRGFWTNCRTCGCCFKTQFGNFTNGWISSENAFVALTRKGETLPKWAATYWKRNFSLSSRKENLSPQEQFALRAEQRLEIGCIYKCKICNKFTQIARETARRCFRKLEKNWTLQLAMNNYCDWKEWVNPLIPNHVLVI